MMRGYLKLILVCILIKKYENYVFNSDSAFFYHGLTDNIPLKYHLAGKRGVQKIKNNEIVQTYMDDKYFEIGDSFIDYNAKNAI